MRAIGIHIRLADSMTGVIERALRLGVPFFQCFMVAKKDGKVFKPTAQDVQQFLELRDQNFGDLYVHGSYWINFAGIEYTGQHALQRELRLAKRLEFDHLILHPGSASGALHKRQGIEQLAKSINLFTKYERSMYLILENTAHAGMSIGGDIDDFKQVLELVDQPDRVSFCIDTAHAYSFGYDIVDPIERERFITLLATTIGLDKIVLIHLNDTTQLLGSYIDQHEIVGKGTIGTEALKAFVMDERLKDKPLVLELPVIPEEQEKELLAEVRSWHE